MRKKLKIAVIGSGISGLSAAWLLSKSHLVTIYEKNNYLGGHSNTQNIITKSENANVSVDTGFIVFNQSNYKNLSSFFELLNVSTYETDMSFSVSINNGLLEYGGASIGSLFAQKTNILKKDFWVMLLEIVKFYSKAELDKSKYSNLTISDYLDKMEYSDFFIKNHLLPMAASIWSAPIDEIKQFPFSNFVDFFKNHGLLNLVNRPKWKTIVNGSREYVKKIISKSEFEIKLSEKVKKVIRKKSKIKIISESDEELFDHIIFACHSDQSLKILNKPTQSERLNLLKIRYKKNTVWLHSDMELMPKRKNVWSSWNYINNGDHKKNSLSVTYWMNNLQDLKTCEDIFVSLNPLKEPRKEKIYKKFIYSHPLYDANTISGQQGLQNIQGENNTWFCGAYLGNGFHEDGIKSGLSVAESLGKKKRPW